MKSKTIGSILIFTGTCVGAGILALPLSTAGLGFFPAAGALFVNWLLSVITAMLVLEVLIALPKKKLNFDSMSRMTLGRPGQLVCLIAYLVLLYSVSSAYLSGGTSMLIALLGQFGISMPSWLSALMFTLILGGIVYGGHRVVDFTNRGLLSVKGLSFIALASLLIPDVTASNLFALHHSMPYLWAAFPVLFFSFGMQIMVPSMYSYLEMDAKELRKAILIGSLIPFLLYLLWLAVTLGILPRFGANSYDSFLQSHSSSDIGALFAMLGHLGSKGWGGTAMGIFTNVAVTTSFLAVTMALKDYVSDIFRLKPTRSGKNLGALITYLPPLLLVFLAPSIFLIALQYAAASLAVVMVFLPVAMTVSVRRTLAREQRTSEFRVMGGTGMLVFVSVFGVVVVALSFMASMHMLPELGFA
ncbi:amino acid permease [Dongshaea marina]|uniref:amino acid permease n=1 Tax=Dongshaea marina TaxID=2047966 RepID=UPI000D3EC0BA|nr:aromatic amino acid transport family protein [Dongshaea marina]